MAARLRIRSRSRAPSSRHPALRAAACRALRVTPEMSERATRRTRLAFRIEAQLWGQPAPQQLVLRTRIDVDSGSVNVADSGCEGWPWTRAARVLQPRAAVRARNGRRVRAGLSAHRGPPRHGRARVRRSVRRAAAGRVRVPGRACATEARRAPSRFHPAPAGNGLSPFPVPDALLRHRRADSRHEGGRRSGGHPVQARTPVCAHRWSRASARRASSARRTM